MNNNHAVFTTLGRAVCMLFLFAFTAAASEIISSAAYIDSGPPVITRTGSSTVEVECGATYTDAGATATDNCDGNVTANISVTNPVDTSVPNTYTVRYNVTDSAGLAATEVTRTVHVVDTTAPVITLNGVDPMTVECGDDYTDAGATAEDVCHGNLTGDIVTDNPVDASTPGIYTVSYNVTDASDNAAAEVTRTVTVADTTPPVITLLGEAVMTLTLCPDDDAPMLPGATALDACGGDLTADILVGGDPPSTEPGEYVITYNVSDSAGNAAMEVTRTVQVQIPDDVNIVLGVHERTVECGDSFEAPQAEVRDACGDGFDFADVTGTVNTQTPGEHLLTYSYPDAEDMTLIVTVIDTLAPALTLAGEETVLLEDCALYEEAGLAAIADACEGDMGETLASEDVLVTLWSETDGARIHTTLAGIETEFNAVYAEIAGNYVLTYSVEDSAGNTGVAERTIVVVCIHAEGEQPEGEDEQPEGEEYTVEEWAELLLQVFDEIDANRDDTLTLEEVRAVVSNFDAAIFDQMDLDGDGTLTRDELLTLLGIGPDTPPVCGCLGSDGFIAVAIGVIGLLLWQLLSAFFSPPPPSDGNIPGNDTGGIFLRP